jgi:uncharacterized membrane protein YphA (DoxX/SURF4 family)
VPLVELSAGGAVVIGLVAPLAALGLLVIILIASATSGRERIKAYKPIDKETGSMIGSIWRKTLYMASMILSLINHRIG